MKRSELIKKAAEEFEEHSNNQQYKGYSHEGMVETILDIFERLDMLKPFAVEEMTLEEFKDYRNKGYVAD
jgi:hypothetical protein